MVVSAPDKTISVEPKLSDAPPKRRNWLAFVAACLALQLGALLFTECVLYVAGLGEEEIFAFDKELGTKHMTNKRITWRSEGFGCTYLDADGLQDPGLTVAKPANTYRVAVLGDSMVEGLQVPGDKKFTRLLNRSVKLANGKNVQFVNFGTSGYSTAQEYTQLKNQVFKYAPDMVVVCYHSRDIFENWSPPDATLTNIRPVAICLPGQPLVVSNAAIQEWMKSPRAKFLQSISWIRQNSRIWGLISAMETELSFNDKTYQTIMELVTRPKKALKRIWEENSKPERWDVTKWFASSGSSGPSFNIQFFEGKDPNAQVNKSFPTGAQKKKKKQNAERVAKAKAAAAAAAAQPKKPVTEGERNYIKLMSRTLDALVTEMNAMCAKHNTKFVMVSLPARLGVAPLPGAETTMYGLDYAGEVDIVRESCAAKNIPFCDLLQPATQQLSEDKKKSMFYSLHLAPEGHKFIADQLTPFFEKECNNVGR
jgi:hypothetical protein